MSRALDLEAELGRADGSGHTAIHEKVPDPLEAYGTPAGVG
jgi:hypothetical protein